MNLHRITAAGLLMSGLMVVVSSAVLAAPTTQPGDRDQLMRSLNEDARAWATAIPTDLDLSDAAARSKVGVTVIPIIRHAMATIDQLPPNCSGQSMTAMKFDWELWLIVFGDKDFMLQMQTDSVTHGDLAVRAKLCLASADEVLGGKDVAKTEAAARRVLTEARTVPTSDYASLALVRLKDDDRLPAQTKAEIVQALSESRSTVAAALRFAAKYASTQPSR